MENTTPKMNDVAGRATHRVAPTMAAGSLGAIIGQFKSVTTKRINQTRNTPGAPVWQRNYYEHIIRNDSDLHAIRQYISSNPAGEKHSI
jgi:REP element-mobilizing transposase RayT